MVFRGGAGEGLTSSQLKSTDTKGGGVPVRRQERDARDASPESGAGRQLIMNGSRMAPTDKEQARDKILVAVVYDDKTR